MAAEPVVRDADVVYIPAHPIVSADRKEVGFETRELESGGRVALAFTSKARLVEALGHFQPWLAMPLGRLRRLMAENGISQVAVDPSVPAKARRWTPDDLEKA